MSGNDQDPQKKASFFGGGIDPEDQKPQEEKAPEPPKEQAPPAADGSAGFLGGAQNPPEEPAPPPADTPAPQAEPAPQQTPPAIPDAPQPQAEAPATPPPVPQPQAAPEPEEEAQPLPPPTAPAIEFFTRAEELYDSGFLVSAITAYRRGLEKEPSNVVMMNNLAMVFIEKSRFEEACVELERAIELGSTDPELHSNIGFALRKLGRDLEAADHYETYINANPGTEEAAPIRQWIEKVRASAPAEDAAQSAPAPAASAPSPQPAAEVSGPVAELFAQATAAFEAEDYNEALFRYEKILEIDLENAQALAGRGKTQAKLGLMEEGLATLREAAEMNPNDSETHYVIGFILRALERDSEAATAYERFIELSPDAPNSEKIKEWIEEVREKEGKLKIDLQPAWAQAMEEPAPEYADVGMPETEATLAKQEAEEQEQPTEETPEADAGEEAPSMFAQAPEPEPEPEPTPPEPKPQPAEEPEEPAPAAEEEPQEEPQAQAAPDTGSKIENTALVQIQDALASGDTDLALSRAQEAVGMNPNFTEGKIIIARCFGKKGEFKKALTILKAIVSSEESDEAFFLMGRCQQELGKPVAAKESFGKCLECATNEDMKARVEEILSQMEDEPQDSQEEENEPAEEAEDKPRKGKKAAGKKAKPAAKAKSGSGVKILVAVVVLLAVLGGAGFVMKEKLLGFIKTTIQNAEPVSVTSAPAVPDENAQADSGATDDESGEGETVSDGGKDEGEPLSEKLEFLSPPLSTAVAGVEIIHHLKVSKTKDKTPVEFEAEFSRKTSGAYSFDKNTGLFKWTPAAGDVVDGELTITFKAKRGEQSALPQPCVVRLRDSVRVGALGPVLPVVPGEAFCMTAGDMTGDGKDDILVAYGTYWKGGVELYSAADGEWKKVGAIPFGGRPVGIGIGNFGDGSKKALIADYWNKCLRYAEFRDGRLLLLPQRIALPGHPLKVDFGNPDGKGPAGLAILMSEGTILIYDAMGGKNLEIFRRLQTPNPGPWKAVSLVDLDADPENTWSEVVLVRMGKAQPSTFITALKEGARWESYNIGSGIAQSVTTGDIAGEPEKPRKDFILASGSADAPFAYTVMGQPGGKCSQDRSVPLGSESPAIAMAVGDLDNNGFDDLICLLKDRVVFRLRTTQGKAMKLSTATLPRGAAPPMTSAVCGEFTGDGAQDIVYTDRGGRLMIVTSKAAK